MSGIERRAYKRFRVDPILCHTVPQTEGVCVLRNVSLNGAFFLTPSPPTIGTNLDVEFREEPLDGYQLTGTVVRQENAKIRGFGITFIEPHPRLLRAVYCAEFPD